MDAMFLSLEDVSVRLSGKQVLKSLNLNILKGQQWAITGPSGSGKTVLAQTLMGHHFHTGNIRYPSTGARIAVVEQQHRFRNRSGTSDLYYQQRFNASDADQTMTVEQELAPHLHGADVTAREWLDHLHIRPLLNRPLIQLSNGENKRTQLAIALLESPDLLILDNPFLGLDTEGRRILHDMFNMLAGKGIQLLLITTPKEMPDAVTHIARLEAGVLTFAGPRKEQALPTEATSVAAARLDEAILGQLRQLAAAETARFTRAVRMVDVTVTYGDKTLLKNISWEVRRGERWSVSGPNGAGKSTLLSLITADNPQAYSNDIWLFDRKRGTGETIWEIKQQIGFVSPELHLYFDYTATCYEVIASGLFDTIGLFRQLSDEQSKRVLLWMELLSLHHLRLFRLAQLSAGEQRMVLLARALIKNPPLLILDEPGQGLDDAQSGYFRQLIDTLCVAFDTTLIYVSHYKEDLPDCVDRFLKLDNGVIVP